MQNFLKETIKSKQEVLNNALLLYTLSPYFHNCGSETRTKTRDDIIITLFHAMSILTKITLRFLSAIDVIKKTGQMTSLRSCFQVNALE